MVLASGSPPLSVGYDYAGMSIEMSAEGTFAESAPAVVEGGLRTRNASRAGQDPVVLLCGFEPLFAERLSSVLSASALLKVVRGELPPRDVPRAIAAHRPDAALLCWEAMDVAELPRVTGAYPGVGVVVLARTMTAARARMLVRLGAMAALERGVPRHVLVAATILAGHGMRTEPRSDSEGSVVNTGEAGHGGANLSEREAEVLGLLECGESLATIARLFGVSVETIRSQTRSIYRKLDVHSRSELRERRRNGTGDGGAEAQRIPVETSVIRLDCVRRARWSARRGWLRPPLPGDRRR